MTVADIVVIVRGGIGLMAVLAWYFFAPQKATRAELAGGVQTVDIVVRGGHSPNLVWVTAGTPVRLRFDRQDSSDCTSRVMFPHFRRSASLAPFATTTLDLTVDEPGAGPRAAIRAPPDAHPGVQQQPEQQPDPKMLAGIKDHLSLPGREDLRPPCRRRQRSSVGAAGRVC